MDSIPPMPAAAPNVPGTDPAPSAATPVQPAPATASQATVPGQPQQGAPQTIDPGEKKSSKKLIVILIAGVLIIGIVVAGIYLYMNNKQSSTNKTQVNNTPVPVIEQQAPKEDLQGDLNKINVATDESDLAPLDQDLQGL